MFEITDGPRIERRPEMRTLGIRLVTPFRGMLAVRDELLSELGGWLAARRIEPSGPFFLRLHTVDMSGDMEIEVGVLDAPSVPLDSDERVQVGSAPAGDYALLAYRGSSMQANKTLLTWAAEHGQLAADPDSGAWAGRFEIFRTDPRTEQRKTKWTVELAFLFRSRDE